MVSGQSTVKFKIKHRELPIVNYLNRILVVNVLILLCFVVLQRNDDKNKGLYT